VPSAPERGSVIRIDPKIGRHEIVAAGLRTPNGIGLLSDGSIWLTDNQGDWLPSSTLMKLVPDAFYGAHTIPPHPFASRPETPPVAWLPQGEIGNSPSQPTDLRVGPWKGQILHGDVTHGGLKRTFIQPVTRGGDTVLNGCVFRFFQGFTGGVNRVAWGPDGSLYVGQIGSTGDWAQEGKKWFGLERLTYTSADTFEPLAVRLCSNGLEVEFTQPLSSEVVLDPTHIRLRQWRYQRTSSYGGGKLDDEPLPVTALSLSPDRKRLSLIVPGIKENRVVYLRLPHTLRDTANRPLWTTEAWYTVNALPDSPAIDAPPATVHNRLTADEVAAGWTLLFDGQTTQGWRGFKRQDFPAGWQIQDGTLTRVSGGGDIITTEQFGDFELVLDWKVAPGGNSGIFYRVAEDADAVWFTGPEMQILDNTRHPDGRDAFTSAGSCYALYAPTRDTTFGADRWNTVRVIARGTRIEHWVNGEKVIEFDTASDDFKQKIAASKFASLPQFARLRSGHIALQDHGDRVAYRNIKIRKLP
jgi:cytochrome c